MSIYGERLKSEEIRLLTLLPGCENDTIVCRLETVDRAHAKDAYRALSYVWGSGPTEAVVCNNILTPVGANLHQALKLIRKKRIEDPLWVDAICINQDDLLEKTEQVRKMQNVYADARLAIAFIEDSGPDDESGADLLLHVLNVLSARFPEFRDRSYLQDILIENDTTDIGERHLSSVEKSRWEHLAGLAVKTYFTRVWIIQEMVCAADMYIYIGAKVISASDVIGLMYAGARFNNLWNTIQRTSARIEMRTGCCNLYERLFHFLGLRHLYLSYKTSYRSMPSTLWLARNAHASVPMDRIFAIVGLVPGVTANIIDYNRTEDEIQINVAKACVQGPSNFGPLLLSFCDASHRSDSLPSWVPDWIAPGYRPCPFHLSLPQPATKDIEKRVCDRIPTWYVNSLDEFVHQGRVFDRIGAMTDEIPVVYHLQTNPGETNLVPWLNSCEALLPSKYPTGESSESAFLRALFFNENQFCFSEYFEMFEKSVHELKDVYHAIRDIQGLHAKDHQLAQDMLEALEEKRQMPKHPRFSPRRWSADIRSTAGIFALGLRYGKSQACRAKLKLRLDERLLNIIEMNARGRRFGVTEAGYIGWFPLATQRLDDVCTFDGSMSSFVKRKSGNNYRLIGEAWILDSPVFTPFLVSEYGWREIVLE